MATTSKTWAWASDVDGWRVVNTSLGTLAWTGSYGSPANGSIYACGTSSSEQNGLIDNGAAAAKTWREMFTSLPAGSTVTAVEVTEARSGPGIGASKNRASYIRWQLQAYIASSWQDLFYYNDTSLAGSWITHTPASKNGATMAPISSLSLSCDSAIKFQLIIRADGSAGSGVVVPGCFDNLIITVTYQEGGSPQSGTANYVDDNTPTVYEPAASFELDFDSELTGLDPDTHYYVRAYATTTNGTAYGDEEEFDTEAGSSPQYGTANYVERTPVIHEASGSPGGVSGEANFVERTPVVYQPGAVATYDAEANLVPHNAGVYEVTGVPGNYDAVAEYAARPPTIYEPQAAATYDATANYVERTPAVHEATGTPGGLNGAANYVEHSSAVHEASGASEGGPQYGTANYVEHSPSAHEPSGAAGGVQATASLVEHESAVEQPSGAAGGISGGASYVEHASSAYEAAGIPGGLAGEANLVVQTAQVFEPSGAPGGVSATGQYVQHDPVVYEALGGGAIDFNSELTSLDPATHYYVRAYATTANGTAYGDEEEFDTDGLGEANLVVNTPTVYEASGAAGAQAGTANYVERTPTVYQATGEESEASVFTGLLGLLFGASKLDRAGTANLVEHPSAVLEATGTPSGDSGTASFVEHAPAVHEASGVPGGVSAEASVCENAPVVYNATGIVAGAGEANAVLRTPVVYEVAGVQGGVGGEASYVTHASAVYTATGDRHDPMRFGEAARVKEPKQMAPSSNKDMDEDEGLRRER